jgi:hypothetical protein
MSIYKKLFEAKKEIGVLTKDSKNPFFKSNYLSLNGLIDAVEEVLEKHELLLLQPIEDGKVITRILSTEKDGMVQSELSLPNIQDPQKLGSAITYYRRYTLQSLLGLQAQDDDGNKAQKQVKEERKPSLTTSGFDFLKSDKATKEQILEALEGRRMTTVQRTELTKLSV